MLLMLVSSQAKPLFEAIDHGNESESTGLPTPTLLFSAVKQCCGISHLQWLAWVDKVRCDKRRLLDAEVAHEAGREDTPHEGQGRAIFVHPQGH